MIQLSIERKIIQKYSPPHYEVINESANHKGPKDAETHFKVVIVSKAFEDKKMVERHREVYQLLDKEIKQGVHALAIHPYAPGEWERLNHDIDSPKCRGGDQ